jgi:hypothetical protein
MVAGLAPAFYSPSTRYLCSSRISSARASPATLGEMNRDICAEHPAGGEALQTYKAAAVPPQFKHPRPETAGSRRYSRPTLDAGLSRPYCRTRCSARIGVVCRWTRLVPSGSRERRKRKARCVGTVRSTSTPTA